MLPQPERPPITLLRPLESILLTASTVGDVRRGAPTLPALIVAAAPPLAVVEVFVVEEEEEAGAIVAINVLK